MTIASASKKSFSYIILDLDIQVIIPFFNSFCHLGNPREQQASSRSQKNKRQRGDASSEVIQLPADNLVPVSFWLDGVPPAPAFGETFLFSSPGQPVMEQLFISKSGPDPIHRIRHDK
jgi:hypothetical protein